MSKFRLSDKVATELARLLHLNCICVYSRLFAAN